MSNNPTHVKLYIGKEFHRMLRDLAENYEDWSIREVFGSEVWKLKLTGAKRGKTFYKTMKVTIPKWSIGLGRDYSLYYMLHELAHVVTYGHGHDDEFKRVENELLARYNLSIVRRKGSPYPKQVFANGVIVPGSEW